MILFFASMFFRGFLDNFFLGRFATSDSVFHILWAVVDTVDHAGHADDEKIGTEEADEGHYFEATSI